MKAELKPLDGKYYGTEVEIFDYEGSSAGIVVIWLNPNLEKDYKPSKRELEQWNEEYEICDNHYETELAHKIAETLVKEVK